MTSYKFRARSKDELLRQEAEEERDRAREESVRRNGADGAVHENLRNLRLRLKLNKQEMAELMEVTPRTYYGYERGQRTISSDVLVRLAVLTGVDMNEILLGRPARARPETIESAISDFCTVLRFLDTEYPDMDMNTRTKVARLVVTYDWDGALRIHPQVIRDAVKMVTRYRFHPEDLPAPPFWEDYGEDQDQYERDMAAWQRMVDEDLGEAPGRNAAGAD